MAFTFHYASTLSETVEMALNDLVIFTFHYASTLSCFSYLLSVFRLFIYIPLCFYFIIDSINDQGLTLIFTFHYASTLSEYCK